MEMLELRDLHKTFNPGTIKEKIAFEKRRNAARTRKERV